MTPKVSAVLVAALNEALEARVATQTVDPLPDEFVRVTATGGPELQDEVLDWADFAWEAWAPTQSRAEDLAGEVRDAINVMRGTFAGAYVVTAKSRRPVWFPDDTTNRPRYVGQARVLMQAV